MKPNSAAILALVCILPFLAGCRSATVHKSALPTGVIAGVISVHGPAAQPISLSKHQKAVCRSLLPYGLRRQDRSRRLQPPAVFVWISSGLPDRKFTPPAQAVVLTQLGCRFIPRMLAAMPGQTIDFTNTNRFAATLRVKPHATGNAAFTLTLPPFKPGKRRAFSTPELMIPVSSPGHPEMRAYINIVTNPFYALPGPHGHFVIRGVPPGTYTLSARQPSLGVQTRSVTVHAHSTTQVNFAFPAKAATPSHSSKPSRKK